jgi:endonuclease/exonuclease/phosphatase family metal-dependent hydrolase
MSTLRLMTYNVRYFGHGTRGVVSTRNGVRRIAETVASLEPLVDVICLQEVEARSLRSSLVTRHPTQRHTMLQALLSELERQMARRGVRERYQAIYFPAHRYRITRATALYTTGLAMLVRPRLTIVDHNAHTPQDITHRRGVKQLKQTRIVAHMTVEHATRGMLDVFNTHLSLPGWFYKEFWSKGKGKRFGHGPNQLVEAARIAKLIEQRRKSDHVVLVGDFNSAPNSPVDRLFQQQVGLTDALARAKGLVGEHLERWPTAGFMNKRMNIDRIYSSPGIEWLDFAETMPFGHGPFHGLSDHMPLVGSLRLPR